MWLDHWILCCLVPVALWILVSGLDDLFISIVFLVRGLLPHKRSVTFWPSAEELRTAPRSRIAILVPLWREQDVIARMLEHNIAVIEYKNYDIFAGVYSNDSATKRAIESIQHRHPHVHLATCPHPGPTSKADCLNSIYRCMEEWERGQGVRFEIVVTHDAEDLIHPQALAVIDYFSQQYDMVQIPVLPLPSPPGKLIHGLYCDEFAEYQLKDVPMRHWLGGFLPSNGVGTGFSRIVLERLERARAGEIFEPECLTEDYENGWAVHALGCPQIFVPVTRLPDGFGATREYFPSTFQAALRQRTRWVTGIALQGWERHGWDLRSAQCYWFWRDRKGLIGNLLAPAVNLTFLYGGAAWLSSNWLGLPWSGQTNIPGWLRGICQVTMAISAIQIAMRAGCAARIYGLRFAVLAPVRMVIGNWLNSAATLKALGKYARSRLRHSRLAWGKTEHKYPEGELLKCHKPKLGQILVRMRYLSAGDLDEAIRNCPAGLRLGEYLHQLRRITDQNLFQALSLQSGLPLEDPPRYCRTAVRLMPVAMQRKLGAMPVRIQYGRVDVAVADLPGPRLEAALAGCCSLEVRYCLVTPSQMSRLQAALLQDARAINQGPTHVPGWSSPSDRSRRQ